MKRDESASIRQVVDAEIGKRDEFMNLHGITVDNVESFLVAPFKVPVDPDDLETQVRPMWVVLQESDDPTHGYVIVYDPVGRSARGLPRTFVTASTSSSRPPRLCQKR